jgi:hypothetical protein
LGSWNLLRRNFVNPSKVWARPESIPPTAAKAVCMTLRIALRRDCITASTEPKAAVKVWKTDDTSELRESIRPGMIELGLCLGNISLERKHKIAYQY